MKTEEFENKDGNKGQRHKFEPGDKVTFNFDSIYEFTGGQFPNYSVQVTHNGEDKYVRLTNTQADALKKAEPLKGKVAEAYEYENKFGKQVGIKVL